jgi:hypothetical protein
MTRTTLRGRSNEIIGYMEDCPEEILIRDSKNRRLGRYSKNMDMSYDAHGKIISSNGNTIMTLLRD